MAFLSSLKSIAQVAFFSSQFPISPSPSPLNLGVSRTCPDAGLSCSNNAFSIHDTCCTNTPGGQFAQTQFWNSDASAGPPGYLGPNNTWTIHGLWPDHCDGRYDSVCDCSRSGDCSSANRKCNSDTCNREYSSITDIMQKYGEHELLEYMDQYWKGINGNEHLWQHEWSKHGTCVSTLEPKCYEGYQSAQEVVDYFRKSVELYKTLPTFEVTSHFTPYLHPRIINRGNSG
jgi:ribonuclease T2